MNKSMMKADILGIGVWSPRFGDWATLADWLTNPAELPEPTGKPKAERIPARERRRAPLAVKQAVEVAGQACDQANVPAAEVACLFATAMGDMSITDYMCRILADTPEMLSPTRFHNSVHNAPVGYWSIATGAHAPANTISALDYTWPMTLLEGLTQMHSENRPVLLVSQDVAAVGPLEDVYPVAEPFATALLLAPASGTGHELSFSLEAGTIDWPELSPSLDELNPVYQSNPSARLLPLLASLAKGQGGEFNLPLNQHMGARVSVALSQNAKATA